MKKFILFGSLISISNSYAIDYKISLEARSDLSKTTTKTSLGSGATDKDSVTSFKNNMLRINLFSQVNDSLSFRLRQRFTNTATATTARDNSNNLTDFIYIDHKNNWFTSRLGKQSWTQAAGRESFVSGSDAFLSTDAITDFRSVMGEYKFGYSAMYKVMDTQNFTVGLSNPNTTITDTTGSSKNNSISYGFYYNGSFFDKYFQPVLAYTASPQDKESSPTTGNETKKGTHTLIAAGTRSEFSAFALDLDYKIMKKANRNAGTNTSLKEEETKSIYASMSYTANEFTPFVQYFNDKKEFEGTATSNYKKSSYVVGLAYKPFNETNLRYHIVYASSKKEIDSTLAASTKKISETNILLGFKADI